MAKQNPHKANQYIPDPRQAIFLSYYLDPKSETFSNACQSALKAGFSKEYAEVITSQMPTWLSESLSDNKMIQQAEKNLNDFLNMDGEGKEKYKLDATKFALTKLKKEKYGDEDKKPEQALVINHINFYDRPQRLE